MMWWGLLGRGDPNASPPQATELILIAVPANDRNQQVKDDVGSRDPN